MTDEQKPDEQKPDEQKPKRGRPPVREFVDVNMHPIDGTYLFKKVFSSEGAIHAGTGAEVLKADAEALCDGPRKMCRRITREALAKEKAARNDTAEPAGEE
jgi:hypothetical protein